ncbi:DUF4198 domain-containing protein [Spirosoma spitsbergense]|uniref:DUF4198 domain-containing protein n=1 Tax=Spirosoma spitsbergense TaxID=431554 RepID=UPI000380FB62|nr:DUF4198 domain-containing protein [Spirosoma spitsbergense]
MKKRSLITGLSILVSVAFGHEFWLEPTQFYARVGESIRVQILVGENFTGERSEGKKNRLTQYRHYTATGTEELSPTLLGDSYGDVTVRLKTPGTHLISFANTPKFLAMKPDSFLLYLEEDGLDNVIEARKKQGNTDKPSREVYQRCVKTLVQVDNKFDDTFAKNTGLMLEISPTKNPYGQHPGQTAAFRILFDGKPLAGALVRYWNRDAANHVTEEKQRSNAQGTVRFTLRAGANMVSAVRMIPHNNPAEADWHSYWGSLTFGCR